jgi:hypothetical protein
MAIPPKLQQAADRLNTWIGLYTVVAGLFVWLGRELEVLKPYGWPEAILFGVVLAALVTLVAAAFMVAYRKFKPLPTATPQRSDLDATIDFTPQERIDGLEALRDTVGAVASALREQEAATKGFATAAQLVAVNSSIEDAVARLNAVSDSLKTENRAILQLVDFAVHQATVTLLGELVRSAPQVRPDAELNDATREEDLAFIQRVRSAFPPNTHRGMVIANVIQMAEHEAEETIESTPIEQRNPADPIRFRRWAIASRQAAKLVTYLVAQKRESEQHVVGCRNVLIEQLTARSS